MNRFRTSRRLSGLLAFVLSTLLYAAGVTAVFLWTKKLLEKPTKVQIPAPIRLEFAQIELQASVPEPELEPEPPPPVEDADIALEEPPEEEPPPDPPEEQPEPEPEEIQEEPEPDPAPAQVSQEAAAPQIQPVDPDALKAWVQTQIEQAKYYPPTMKRAGIEGQFIVSVVVNREGVIESARIVEGQAHPVLRSATQKILGAVIGRDFGHSLDAPQEIRFDFGFDLQ